MNGYTLLDLSFSFRRGGAAATDRTIVPPGARAERRRSWVAHRFIVVGTTRWAERASARRALLSATL